jgi:general secretion pathway protein J
MFLDPNDRRVAKAKERGFTLLEILVALTIFAVVGLISAQLLSRTVESYGVLEERGERLAQIHRAMMIVQRDLMQYRSRKPRSTGGDSPSALMIGDEGALVMTRAGWRNPLQRPRSELQRVGYRLQGDDLVRAYWPILDGIGEEEPVSQTLLEQVDELEFFVLDEAGTEHKFWPPEGASSDAQLTALILRIRLQPVDVVERIWEVPNGGF